MSESSILELLKTILFLLAFLALIIGGVMAIMLHLKSYLNRIEAMDAKKTAETIREQNQKDQIALLEMQREVTRERQEFFKEKIESLKEKRETS